MEQILNEINDVELVELFGYFTPMKVLIFTLILHLIFTPKIQVFIGVLFRISSTSST